MVFETSAANLGYLTEHSWMEAELAKPMATWTATESWAAESATAKATSRASPLWEASSVTSRAMQMVNATSATWSAIPMEGCLATTSSGTASGSATALK